MACKASNLLVRPLRGVLPRAIAIVLATTAAADAANLYRYRNDTGVVVVDWQIPPEYVAHGYEVLNEAGLVVEVVPKALSSEEVGAAESAAAARARAKREAERQQQHDESLLRRYSSTEDIEAARERSLSDLKIRVSMLKSNQRTLRQRVENAQARVAEAERSGLAIRENELEAINSLKQEIAATDRAISERQAQIEAVDKAFQADIDRFGELQGLVELRRSLERPQP